MCCNNAVTAAKVLQHFQRAFPMIRPGSERFSWCTATTPQGPYIAQNRSSCTHLMELCVLLPCACHMTTLLTVCSRVNESFGACTRTRTEAARAREPTVIVDYSRELVTAVTAVLHMLQLPTRMLLRGYALQHYSRLQCYSVTVVTAITVGPPGLRREARVF